MHLSSSNNSLGYTQAKRCETDLCSLRFALKLKKWKRNRRTLHNTQNSKNTFYQAKTFSLKNADNKFMVECYIFANELCNVLITSETLFKLITMLAT